MVTHQNVYWRLNGETYWRYGWPTSVGSGLFRMGLWNGDTHRGPIVDEKDIEIKS